MLSKSYEPKDSEKKWQKFWEKEKIYKFDPDSKKELFSVDSPPPTVSGNMHIGHAFSYSQQDFVIRHHRMRGKNIFYPFGTDDNGLPTEKLVEKLRKVRASKMDRNEFIQLCLTTLKEIKPKFIQDWKDIGVSCDWDIYYSTIDKHSQKISQASFLDLLKKDRAYQKEAPTMWCHKCETAISQVELEDVELPSHFNDIIFKLENGKDLIIATTRPELLSSCVAVVVHPDDKRYKSLVGKKVKVPLFNFEVKVIADKRVSIDKGTGAVMCCTFGDQTDIEWYKAYNLPLKVSFTKDGKMTDLAGKYKDLPIKDARKQIIEDLKQNKLLISQKDIVHAVNVHERCQTEVEILNTKQWFVKYLDIKDKLLKAGKEMNWYPKHMSVRYDHWIAGLQWDWCISRQRHFGVPFPLWYCPECKKTITADESQLPVDPLKDKPKNRCKCKSELIPEKDVLDTWATSSLSPNLAADLFKDKPIYKKLLPMTLRPQAHDIITFWLFNTVVKSLLHRNTIPFENIMISGFALDPHGKKMSKSKGNVVEPKIMLEKYSADALRFWAAGSKLGDDLPFQEKDLLTGKKTTNKLFNSAKFAEMHLGDYKNKAPKQLEIIDAAILSKLNTLVKDSTKSYDSYEYAKSKADTELFFWRDFCDNYLEIVKDRLFNPDKRGKEARLSGQYTLHTTLLTILKLFAPIMPHITEEIYQELFKKTEKESSIHISSWPEYDGKLHNKQAEQIYENTIAIITQVRKNKSENNKSVALEIDSITIETDKKTMKTLPLEEIKATCRAKEIKEGKGQIICTDTIKINVNF